MYYFASDVHLGLEKSGESRARELVFVKWLDEVSPNALAIYLVGDIFDFWYEYKRVVPKGFTRLLGKLSELSDRGVEIHYFVGNHDIWSFGYLSQECGVILHKEPYCIVELYGKQVLIGHGDVLGKHIRRHRIRSAIFRNKTAQKLFGLIHPDAALAWGGSWSRSSRYSKPIAHKFNGEQERIVKFARDFLTKEDIDLFIFGHLHVAEIYQLNQKSALAILGEWIQSPKYGVLTEEGFSIKNV